MSATNASTNASTKVSKNVSTNASTNVSNNIMVDTKNKLNTPEDYNNLIMDIFSHNRAMWKTGNKKRLMRLDLSKMDITNEQLLNILKIVSEICGDCVIPELCLSSLYIINSTLEEILKVMPYCIYLDISHNKIKRFPVGFYKKASMIRYLNMYYSNTRLSMNDDDYAYDCDIMDNGHASFPEVRTFIVPQKHVTGFRTNLINKITEETLFRDRKYYFGDVNNSCLSDNALTSILNGFYRSFIDGKKVPIKNLSTIINEVLQSSETDKVIDDKINNEVTDDKINNEVIDDKVIDDKIDDKVSKDSSDKETNKSIGDKITYIIRDNVRIAIKNNILPTYYNPNLLVHLPNRVIYESVIVEHKKRMMELSINRVDVILISDNNLGFYRIIKNTYKQLTKLDEDGKKWFILSDDVSYEIDSSLDYPNFVKKAHYALDRGLTSFQYDIMSKNNNLETYIYDMLENTETLMTY